MTERTEEDRRDAAHALRDLGRQIEGPADQGERAESHRRYDSDRIIDENTGEEVSHDDWGYAETARAAFVMGAQWERSRLPITGPPAVDEYRETNTKSKETTMETQDIQIPEIDGIPTPDLQPLMRCEHDWVDGACAATAPVGTPGWEQRRARNGELIWLCPQSVTELPSESEALDSAVRNAKARAGLDPLQAYHPAEFINYLDPEWQSVFWDRQIERAMAELFAANPLPGRPEPKDIRGEAAEMGEPVGPDDVADGRQF